MMDHPQLIKFLFEELHKLGFKDLEQFDVLKHTSMVRDPITKEVLVPLKQGLLNLMHERFSLGGNPSGSP
ncbi:MAG: hypothetical protein CM15mP48_1740 [Candidatus Poseidoniales archaeon]|nr:MAG: hypothetical protein CM15mP48_1740 [Candidatus Poseidoniales archaeon]